MNCEDLISVTWCNLRWIVQWGFKKNTAHSLILEDGVFCSLSKKPKTQEQTVGNWLNFVYLLWRKLQMLACVAK